MVFFNLSGFFAAFQFLSGAVAPDGAVIEMHYPLPLKLSQAHTCAHTQTVHSAINTFRTCTGIKLLLKGCLDISLPALQSQHSARPLRRD